MRTMRTALGAVAAIAALAALSTGISFAKDKSNANKPTSVAVNHEGSAKWSATTYEAAASEANKKVLKSGKATTVTGEVVDVSCYMELGKRGEAHVACGSKCIEHGAPVGIVDEKGNLYILFAEEHHPRRDGEVDIRKTFQPLLAQNVTVSGMMTEMRGVRALFVTASELPSDVKFEKPPEK